MNISGMRCLDSTAPRGTHACDQARLRDNAAKFEALLIAQMLQTARECGGGGLSGEEDQTDSSMRDMAEECFSEVLSKNGGLGLGKLITAHFSAGKASNPPPKIETKDLSALVR